MKKLFLLLVIVFAGITASAQIFAFGPKVGYQTQQLSTSKADIESGFKNKFTAGLFARVGLGKFYIQPEVLYFRTENLINVDIKDWKNPLSLNRTNIGVPVMLGYKVFDLKLLKMRASVGPQFNFVVGQEAKNNSELEVETEDLKSNSFSMNGIVGVGFDIWLLSIDVNYSFGLSNIMGNKSFEIDGKQYSTDSYRENIFMVTLGLKLISL